MEGRNKKRAEILELVRGMKANKVPIDAVGIQSHIHAGWSTADSKGLREWMRTLRGMGLKIFITEMDINGDDTEMKTDDPAEIDAAIAQSYHDYMDVIVSEPAVAAVLAWGVTDAHSWLAGRRPPPRPGPLPGQAAGPATVVSPGPPAPPTQPEVLPPGEAPQPVGQPAAHRPPQRPLLFDANNKPKSAFFAVRNAFDTRTT